MPPQRLDRGRADRRGGEAATGTLGRSRDGRPQGIAVFAGPPDPRARRRDRRLDERIEKLVEAAAPELLARFGVGPDTAAALLVSAGDNPERLRSEAAWAHLCGVAPISASSGKSNRHRLDRGGDRQANSALWRIAMVRIAHDPETTAYFERKVKEGRSKRDVIRLLKRYVARELYRYLPRG
jgi:transposase